VGGHRTEVSHGRAAPAARQRSQLAWRRMIAALAGGVGAARLLSGLARVVAPEEICAVVNTGDDLVLHGLHISPDLDTVTYTLAGAQDPETGWGLAGDSWAAMEALARYGGQTWFRLGDRDLATHLYRTQRLSEGASLSQVTAEVAAAWGVRVRLLPMSDDPVRTKVKLAGGPEVAFQDYFVALGHSVPVEAVRFEGAQAARPAPGVLAALEEAEVVVVCPSNPVVSIGPILAVPGVAEALRRRRHSAVAVSPLVGGSALKGPADRMLAELGHGASVAAVARLYSELVSRLVVDPADAHLADQVEAAGVGCVVAPAVMDTPQRAEGLARAVLAAARAPARQ
jgi:LPPG:FO 2-phospho-L-lactate transferase